MIAGDNVDKINHNYILLNIVNPIITITYTTHIISIIKFKQGIKRMVGRYYENIMRLCNTDNNR